MADRLRTGYTTGSSATAAAKAALLSIKEQREISKVEIVLPKKSSIVIPIESCTYDSDKSRCIVIKDGGDDPDVTHGAEIVVDLVLTKQKGQIKIEGGTGVGRVTKPGLGLEIGSAAINPVPKKMIAENLRVSFEDIFEEHGVDILISVPKGEELGPKTDNPRIGIKGGISILGTSGIVVPFSTASYAASIRQNLDVVIAMGNDTVVLTTGSRSEDYAKNIIELPEHCFVQMGDFVGYTIGQCSKKRIKKAYVVGFIGKLAKMAAGVKQTHVKGSKVDMSFLAALATDVGADDSIIQKIRSANTARHVSEIISESSTKGFFESICEKVGAHMAQHVDGRVEIEVILFDFEGKILASNKGILLN